MTNAMKYEIKLNLFWAIVWAVVLVGVIVGIFWKPVLYGVAVLAAIMLGSFLHDIIYFSRMK